MVPLAYITQPSSSSFLLMGIMSNFRKLLLTDGQIKTIEEEEFFRNEE